MYKTKIMTGVLSTLFLFSISIGSVVRAIGDPTAKITFKKVEVNNVENPYTRAWEGTIEDSGDRITFKVPVKADLPAEMKMKLVAQFNGEKVGETDVPVCEGFKDELFVKTILDAGTPKDKFPKACPIKAGENYAIEKYTFPSEKIPPGIPNGKIQVHSELYEPGKSPYVTIEVEADFSHQIPGLGR